MIFYAAKSSIKFKEWDLQAFEHQKVMIFYFRDKTVCLKISSQNFVYKFLQYNLDLWFQFEVPFVQSHKEFLLEC